jgi:hypothetical protein
MKKRIIRSFYAGLLLGFISMLITALLALLVWYRHIGWWGKPSIPRYQSIALLLPLQDSVEHLGFLGFALAIAMKGMVYGFLVFCATVIRECLIPAKEGKTEGQ